MTGARGVAKAIARKTNPARAALRKRSRAKPTRRARRCESDRAQNQPGARGVAKAIARKINKVLRLAVQQ